MTLHVVAWLAEAGCKQQPRWHLKTSRACNVCVTSQLAVQCQSCWKWPGWRSLLIKAAIQSTLSLPLWSFPVTRNAWKAVSIGASNSSSSPWNSTRKIYCKSFSFFVFFFNLSSLLTQQAMGSIRKQSCVMSVAVLKDLFMNCKW